MEAAHESQLTAGRRLCIPARMAISSALALTAGLALRLWMFGKFFDVVDVDTLVYGGIAKNLLLHGRYALTVASGETYPTLIRLPGYPLFLAACFRLFGIDNYAAPAFVQIAADLAGCLFLADFARRIAPPKWKSGAAQCALWLAALCPFTAIYAIEPLAEAPTLFMMALALWSAARFVERTSWGNALCFTFAVTYAALLRPDGALVAMALAPPVLIALWRSKPAGRGHEEREQGWRGQEERGHEKGAQEERGQKWTAHKASGHDFSRAAKSSASARALAPGGSLPRTARMVLVCTLIALTPFAAWTWRNWRVFHVFEPLAPRLAIDPGEDPHLGWERWVKSWCLDFVSTYYVYWNVPGAPLDVAQLPGRAFDSPVQRAETLALAADYNNAQQLTRSIDARFRRLADERIVAHPLRYYVWLPLGRMADMWLRPRIENLPIDLDWWVYAHHHAETRFSWAYAGLNALYLLLAFAGLLLRPRFWFWMLAYMVLRSALLFTVTAPEARYTIECFPMLFVLGGVALNAGFSRLGALANRRSQ